MFDYTAYACRLRHELHQCPEIGFELTETLAIVRRELEDMGIAYTERFGKSSIVATINEGKPFTIGLRADMDALPMQEESNNPYPSRNLGCMHACGHDGHTAQMLAVARQLNDLRQELRCCVKILFTPAEEYSTPGCKLMAEDGVMDDIDIVAACHMDPATFVGQVRIREGGINANSMGLVAEFFGKSAHANSQQNGVDAIAMAVQAYTAMQMLVSREVPSNQPCLLNVGAFHAGHTNNIICDYAKLLLSSRTHSDTLTERMEQRIRQICEGVATTCGGSAKVTVTKLLPYVINHPEVTRRMRHTMETVIGAENVLLATRTLGGEDFAFLSRRKPGVMFRLGTRNPEDSNPPAVLHNAHFDIDERCFAVGIPIFVTFVLENQDGFEVTSVEL